MKISSKNRSMAKRVGENRLVTCAERNAGEISTTDNSSLMTAQTTSRTNTSINTYFSPLIALLLALALLPGWSGALELTLVASSAAVYREPHNLVLSPDGRHLYVADNGNDRIAVLDPDSLALLGTFGESELGAPHDVAVAADGTLWIADAGNDRLVRMSEDLIVLDVVEGEPYRFNGPRYFDLDPAGRLYVAGKYTRTRSRCSRAKTIICC